MGAREYLQQVYRLNELINSNLAELEELRALATSITPGDISQDKVQSNPQNDKTGNIVAKIVDLKATVNNEIDEYVDIKKEVRTKIMFVPDNTERLILKYRYLQFLTWEQIAVKLNYTFQWVHVLHKRALKSFEKILNS